MQTPNTRKKAFTLVELIITITILAILGTIAYISFQGYVKDARDGNRIASIRNIEKAVEINFTESGRYPNPDLKSGQTQLQTGALSISGSMVEYSYLGEIGATLTRQLRITKTPTDPLSGDRYTYATTQDGRKYQIASILENPTSYRNTNNLVNQVNADNGYVAKVSGNHTDIVIKEVSNGKFITVVPSIIFDGSGSNILNQSGTLLIVNNKGNLPYSPNKSTSLNNISTAEQIIREIRNNNQATTVTLQIPNGVTLDGSGILNGRWNPSINKENTNWKLYSTGTILASLGVIDPVTGGADYTKLTDVLNGRSVSNTTTTQTTITTSSSYDVGNSLRFNGSSYLSRTINTNGDKRRFSLSTWVKGNSSTSPLISVGDTNAGGLAFLGFYGDSITFLHQLAGPVTYGIQTVGLFRDSSAWYHVVVYVNLDDVIPSNRVLIYVNGVKQATQSVSSGYPLSTDIDFSTSGKTVFIGRRYHSGGTFDLKFSGYISDFYWGDGVEFSPTSFGQFDTNGKWVPIKYSGSYGTNGFHLDFSNSGALGVDTSEIKYSQPIRSGTTISNLNTPDKAFDGSVYPGNWNGQTASISGDTKLSGYVGKQHSSPKTIIAFRAYGMVDVNFGFVSGSNLGVTMKLQGSNNNSTWIDLYTNTSVLAPITVTGGIDTSNSYLYHRLLVTENGSYGSSHVISVGELELYEAGSYGINSFTPNNFNTYDQMIDTPTNNFSTWNPSLKSSSITLSNGNLKTSTANGHLIVFNNMEIKTPTYFEFTVRDTGNNQFQVGLINSTQASTFHLNGGTPYIWQQSYAWAHAGTNVPTAGSNVVNGGVNNSSYTNNEIPSNGQTFGYAIDPTTGKWWVRNNTGWYNSGDPANGSSPAHNNLPTSVMVYSDLDNNYGLSEINFGQGGQSGLNWCADAGGYFTYCPPSGFKTLSSKNTGN